MKHILLIMLTVITLCLTTGSVFAEVVDAEQITKMETLDYYLGKISSLPAAIDDDLCGNRKDDYKKHMSQLAWYIQKANEAIAEQKLYYPIDLWDIYNTISSSPYCGIAKDGTYAYDVARTSATTNEEMMGIRENSDICSCWNIATGRDEPTGMMKDGACRCIYGDKAYSPQTGKKGIWDEKPEE